MAKRRSRAAIKRLLRQPLWSLNGSETDQRRGNAAANTHAAIAITMSEPTV